MVLDVDRKNAVIAGNEIFEKLSKELSEIKELKWKKNLTS